MAFILKEARRCSLEWRPWSRSRWVIWRFTTMCITLSFHPLQRCLSVSLPPLFSHAYEYLLIRESPHDPRQLPHGSSPARLRPAQTRLLLSHSFIALSIDHRLRPEGSLFEGPMADVCNALEWTRYELPHLKLKVERLKIVAIWWLSRGQLAMSLG
jgi:hypothetical protein